MRDVSAKFKGHAPKDKCQLCLGSGKVLRKKATAPGLRAGMEPHDCPACEGTGEWRDLDIQRVDTRRPKSDGKD